MYIQRHIYVTYASIHPSVYISIFVHVAPQMKVYPQHESVSITFPPIGIVSIALPLTRYLYP